MENPLQKEKRKKRDEEIGKLWPEKTMMEIGKIYKLSAQRVHKIVVKEKEIKAEKIKVNIKNDN
jgi:Mor family transcriptional regulator